MIFLFWKPTMIFLFLGLKTVAEFSHQHKVSLTSTYKQKQALPISSKPRTNPNFLLTITIKAKHRNKRYQHHQNQTSIINYHRALASREWVTFREWVRTPETSITNTIKTKNTETCIYKHYIPSPSKLITSPSFSWVSDLSWVSENARNKHY